MFLVEMALFVNVLLDLLRMELVDVHLVEFKIVLDVLIQSE